MPGEEIFAGIAPGTLCPGHIHVPGAHYTISLVKECRFVVKGCRFASVREKCICYIWVGNHLGHWYRFFISEKGGEARDHAPASKGTGVGAG